MPVSLDLARHRLLSAHEALVENWETTRHVWQDQVGAAFAKERIEPLAPLVATTLGAMDRLSQVLNRVRHDCS